MEIIATKKLRQSDAVIGERADGVKLTKPFFGLTVAEAKEKARRYETLIGYQKHTGTDTEFHFRGWAKTWLLKYKKPFVSDNAYYTTYESIVYQHLLPSFGDILLADITQEDVLALYMDKATLSKSMCGKIQMCLNAIFETAIDSDKCYKNPARFCKLTSTATASVKEVFDDKQILIAEKWFLKRMPEVVLILETGARREEMAGWYKTDFNIKRRLYTIQRAVISQRGKLLIEVPPKNKEPRTNPLSPVAIQAYRILCQQYPESKYLIAGQNDGPISPENWSDRLKTEMHHLAARYEDMPELTSHELRHTYGTYLRRHGVDIYTIAKILGHKSIEVTSLTYVHNELDALRKALKFTRKQELIILE